jgi:hypothetical protein
VSGVHPHQVTVPEAFAPADGPVEFSFWLSPPLQAATAITMLLAAINAIAGRMILIIVVPSATAV